MDVSAASDFIGSGIYFFIERGNYMSNLKFILPEDTLCADGATESDICPASVTGVPFCERLSFEDSSLINSADHKPIYIKKAPAAAMKFTQLKHSDNKSCAVFSELIPAYMKELDENAGRMYRPEWAPKWARSMINIQGDSDRHLELCYSEETLVGFLYGKRDYKQHRGYVRPGWGYIMEFYVLPKYRRNGYGKLMYTRLESLFQKDGVKRMYLTSDPVTGQPFWEAMGFVNTGKISPENALTIYEKDI